MAQNIGPRIGVEGEREYKQQLKDITQSTKLLKAEMERCASSFDKGTNSIKKSAQQHKILKQQQEQLKQKIKTLKDAVKKASEAYGENDTRTKKWKEQLAKAETELNKLNDELKNTRPVQAWSTAIKEAGDKIKQAGDKIKSAGKTLTTSLTVPIAGVGAASVKLAAGLDKAMSQVQATMRLTKDSVSQLNGESVNTMDALRGLAKEMGSTTEWSASQAADAINYMALAGYDLQQTYDTLPSVLALASAGQLDLATTSDMVTDALSALNMKTEDAQFFADTLAVTAASANTSVGQMGEAILKVGGTATMLSGGLVEASTALGIFANNGIKGSEAGTHLRNILLSLNPTTEAAVNAWTDLGVSAYDADGNLRPLNETFKDLAESMQGMSDQEKTDILSKMFNKTDLSSVQALLKDCGDAWDGLAESISNSTGAAAGMAETQLDNLEGSLTKLKSALEGAAISIGERLMPYIEKLTGYIQSAVDWFNGLSDAQLDMVVKVGALVAALGPAIMIVGSIVSAIGSIVTAFGALLPIGEAVVAAVGGLAAGFSLIPIAIAGVGVACIALIANWDKVKAKAGEIKNNVGQKWNELKSNMANVIDQAKARTASQFDEIKNRITTSATAAGSALRSKFEEAKNKVASILESLKSKVASVIDSIKSKFNVTLPTPKLKLPHLSITGSWSFNPPSVPKFAINWYKDAYTQAMEFNSPTILGSRGFGDGNGREYVVGETHLGETVYKVVTDAIGATMNSVYNLLEEYLPGCANQQIYLDGNTLVGATAPRMNAQLGRIAYMDRR